jgi:endonuclease/exonuclease/phosphatase family metal-dependent hydrolase
LPVPVALLGSRAGDERPFRTEMLENPGDARFDIVRKGLIATAGPPPPGPAIHFQRRWHRARGSIQKLCPHTQKSGGALDYVLCKQGLAVQVNIAVDVGQCSDHAAIVACW